MSISDQLRKAIQDAGESANSLSRVTGVSQPTITRFLSGADMKASTIDKLAAYFNLELRPAESKPAKKSKGKSNE